MINNGGCDPFHYIKGNGGLGYKPNAHYMHGLGYDYYNNIDGSGFPRMIGGVISNEEEVRERIKELQSEKELEGQMDKIRKGISEIENNKYYDPDEEKKDLETLRELWEQANNKLVNVVIRDEKIKELQDKNLLKKSFDVYKNVNEYENVTHPQNIRDQVVKIAEKNNLKLGTAYENLVEELKALRHSDIEMENLQLIPGIYNIYDAIAYNKNGELVNWELKNYAAEWPSTKKFGGEKAFSFVKDYQTLKKDYNKNIEDYNELPQKIKDLENKIKNTSSEKEIDKLIDKLDELLYKKKYFLPENIGIKIQSNKFNGERGDQVPLFHKINGEVKLYNIFPKMNGKIDFTKKLRPQDNTKVKALIHLKKGEYEYDLTGDPNLQLVKSYKIKDNQYYKLVPKKYPKIEEDGTPYYHIDPKQLKKIKIEKMT